MQKAAISKYSNITEYLWNQHAYFYSAIQDRQPQTKCTWMGKTYCEEKKSLSITQIKSPLFKVTWEFIFLGCNIVLSFSDWFNKRGQADKIRIFVLELAIINIVFQNKKKES